MVRATIETMASKGKPSPRSAVSPLSDEQVKRLAVRHTLVDSTQYYPTGPRTPNQPEINAQNPKATKRLLGGVSIVFRASCKTKARLGTGAGNRTVHHRRQSCHHV